MKKRSQIQIAIDAMKKQVGKYQEKFEQHVFAEKEIQKDKEFLKAEIDRLQTHIKQLEA